jgi:hypothetical protein
MALSYVYLTTPLAAATASSGKVYTANSLGFITGVAPSDALSLVTETGAPLVLICGTGATTDRPNVIPATAVAGALNNVNPAPPLGFPFWDSTLTELVFFIGTQRTSTGWATQAGVAA